MFISSHQRAWSDMTNKRKNMNLTRADQAAALVRQALTYLEVNKANCGSPEYYVKVSDRATQPTYSHIHASHSLDNVRARLQYDLVGLFLLAQAENDVSGAAWRRLRSHLCQQVSSPRPSYWLFRTASFAYYELAPFLGVIQVACLEQLWDGIGYSWHIPDQPWARDDVAHPILSLVSKQVLQDSCPRIHGMAKAGASLFKNVCFKRKARLVLKLMLAHGGQLPLELPSQ